MSEVAYQQHEDVILDNMLQSTTALQRSASTINHQLDKSIMDINEISDEMDISQQQFTVQQSRLQKLLHSNTFCCKATAIIFLVVLIVILIILIVYV